MFTCDRQHIVYLDMSACALDMRTAHCALLQGELATQALVCIPPAPG